jgi:tetratricopeptide (TPR) repeat protein
MSTGIEEIKKILNENQIVEAIEIGSSGLNTHQSPKDSKLVRSLDEAIQNFEKDDSSFSHYLIKIKKEKQDAIPAQEVSLDTLVNETYSITESLSEHKTETEENLEPQFLFENARLLEETEDYILARNIYKNLIKKGQLLPESYAALAKSYEKEGYLEKAIQCYEEAIAFSSSLNYFTEKAALHIRLGDDDEAIKTLLHSLGLTSLSNEQLFEIHKSIGNCSTRIGNFDQAEYHYRKAYELNPNSDVLQVNVGSLALQKSEHDTALAHFNKALELNQNNEKAISGLGMVYLCQGQFLKAHNSFVKSLEMNLNNLGSIYNLVKCAYEIRSFKDTARLLKAYIESNPVSSNILYSYAGILFHEGNFLEAKLICSKILETSASHAGAQEMMKIIQTKDGNYEKTNQSESRINHQD